MFCINKVGVVTPSVRLETRLWMGLMLATICGAAKEVTAYNSVKIEAKTHLKIVFMRLVILDRDGVINYDSPHYIKSPEECIFIPKSLEAIAALNRAGYTVTVATNQSGIGRGLYSEVTLQRIHQKIRDALDVYGGQVDKIFYCPHNPSDQCDCRKPKPGLFQAIAAWYGCSLEGIPSIGDSVRDIEVAKNAGCLPILVLTGNGEETLKEHPELFKEIKIFQDLFAVAEALIHGTEKRNI